MHFYPVVAGTSMLLCVAASSLAHSGVRGRSHGQFYIDTLSRTSTYRREKRVDHGVRKTYITWENDPVSVARFSSRRCPPGSHSNLGGTWK